MKCDQIRSRLSEYLDDRLSTEDRRQIDSHLRTCAACTAELKLLRATTSALRELPVEKLPAHAAGRLREKLGVGPETLTTDRQARRWQFRPWVAAPALAAVAAVLLVVVVMSTPGPSSKLANRLRAGSPVLLAEFSHPPADQESPPEAMTAQPSLSSPSAEALREQSPSGQEPGAVDMDLRDTGRLLVNKDRNYEPRDMSAMLAPERPQPVGSYEDQVKRLAAAAGDDGPELRLALMIARQRLPESTPLYTELARYRGRPAWLIVMADPSGVRRVLVLSSAGP